MEKKEIWAIGIGIVLVVGFTIWGVLDSKQSKETANEDAQASIVYYYGDDCPHCKDVAKYFEENAISEKVDFVKKEVWGSRKNNIEMMDRAKECGLSAQQVGVPFLWAREECMIGAPALIEFFNAEAGLDQDAEDVEQTDAMETELDRESDEKSINTTDQQMEESVK